MNRSSRTVWRLRSAAVCAVLSALAFAQQPGLITADTKIDLLVNPVGWLGRAAQLWSPGSNFGEVQNQAYGYLWPMGAFFAVGDWLHVPAWAVQRLWWALLLCVAYTGVVALAGRLNIGTPASRMVAGVAFALCPRILTEVGVISGEAWPTAVAPWVLVPLIGLAKGGPVRRRVVLSALALACVGGINATAAFATVPLALIWLALLPRWKVALPAWCLAAAAATVWWIVPLLLLGRYSPPFLDYIESAAVTTRPTDLTSVLRGASHWLAYLGGSHGPLMTAGYRIAYDSWLFAATMGVAVLSLAGLARRGMPHRRFLISGLLVGAAFVTLGHLSSLDTGFSALARGFLDGAGAPLRNVHKFDVLIRLPLALGLAHLVGMFSRRAAFSGRGWHLARRRTVIVTAAALAAVTGMATPALTASLVPAGSFREIPGYWTDAADWLNANLGEDRVLVVPSARFPHYVWGSTADEITQSLLDSKWGVRNAIPLAPANTIRLLDAIDQALTTGAGSAGLASLLSRSGVRYLLVRSDLHYGKTGSARPIQVRQALSRSPGISLVKSFGPDVGGGPILGDYYDYGFHEPAPALEVYQIGGTERAAIYDASEVTTVVGGSESLLDIAASGHLPAAPTVLAGDLGGRTPPGAVTMTDGLRRREVSFGRSQDSTSATMTEDDEWQVPAASHDYLPSWSEQHQTVARYSGISGITASSTWSQPFQVTGARPAHLPYAAVDGDPATSWRAPPGSPAAGQWLELTFDEPTQVPELTVTFDRQTDSFPAYVEVTAGRERVTVPVNIFTHAQRITLSGSFAIRRIRIAVTRVFDTSRTTQGSVGISEISIPGITTGRTLVLPPAPAAAGPADVVVTAAPTVPQCYFLAGRTRCNAALARESEDGGRIDRTVTLPSAGIYRTQVWARPKPGQELDRLLDGQVAVTASSRGIKDPAGRPGSIVDGDQSSAWYADSNDGNAWLRLSWAAEREISGLQLSLDPTVAGTRPDSVMVTSASGTRGGLLSLDGTVVFDQPLRASEITIFLLDKLVPSRSQDPYTNAWEKLPLAVGELTVLPDSPRALENRDRVIDLPCGSGPTLNVAGRQIATKLSVTVRDLLELREVPAEPCLPAGQETISLSPGEVRIDAVSGSVATPARIALTALRATTPSPAGPISFGEWSAASRQLTVESSSRERVLVVRENTNPGWQAHLGGQLLKPVVLDGWQQGWWIPAGMGGEITLTFAPNTTFVVALAAGGVLMLALIAAGLLPNRPGAGPVLHHRHRRRRSGRVLAFIVGAAAIGLIGGVWSALITGAVATAHVIWRRLTLRLSHRDRRWRRRIGALLWDVLPAVLAVLAGVASYQSGDRFRDALPQLLALLALIVLWLSTVARPLPAALTSPIEPLNRPLNEVITDRAERDTTGQNQEEGAHHVPGEHGPALRPVHLGKN